MNQKTITEALQKALVNGSGTLDDLDALLKRAQEDIVKAKEEEKAAAAKAAEAARGKQIAELANRILDKTLTDDDVAFVINTWMEIHGYKGKGLTGADLAEIFIDPNKINKVSSDLEKAINDLTNDIKSWVDSIDAKYNNKSDVKKPKGEDPGDVIDNFLKSFGLR